MAQPKTKKPAKPTPGKKPTKPSVKRPAKPKIAAPLPAATSEQERAAATALTAEDAERTSGYTLNTTPIVCDYGVFRIWDYPGDFSTIAFYNYVTKQTFTTYGRIGREWWTSIDKSGCKDFPIESHRALEPGGDDRITRFSRYALIYRARNGSVERYDYSKFDPSDDSTCVAYGEERKLKYLNKERDHFSNWKGIGNKSDVPAPRRTGKPMQLAFHETAVLPDLKLRVRLNDTCAHFCINRTTVLQWADPAERTFHINVLNERAVGIEFTNTPFEELNEKKEKKFNLDKSIRGLYIKTNLTVDSHEMVHIPLDFVAEEEASKLFDFDVELTVPKEDLVNFDALAAVELGSPPKPILEESGGVVRFRKCRPRQFVRLHMLVQMIEERELVAGLDLTKPEQHLSVVMNEDEQACFLFDKAFRRDGGDYYYGIDVRKTGAIVHGVVFTPHNDGFLQGLYMYLAKAKNLPTQKCLQTIIDLLGSSTSPKKQKPLELEEIVMFRHKASAVETPQKAGKKFKVKDYIVLKV